MSDRSNWHDFDEDAFDEEATNYGVAVEIHKEVVHYKDPRKEIEHFRDPIQVADVRFDFAPYCRSNALALATTDTVNHSEAMIDPVRMRDCVEAALRTVRRALDNGQTVQIDFDVTDNCLTFFDALLPLMARRFTLEEVHRTVRWANVPDWAMGWIVRKLNMVWRENEPEQGEGRGLLFY